MPRPCGTFSDMKTARIDFRVEEKTKEKLEKVAKREKRTLGDTARLLLEKALQRA